MTNAELAARLTEALELAASREAGANTTLVSVEIVVVSPPAAGSITTRLSRRTKTLLFLSAELTGETGTIIASASSVHKLTAV